MALVITLFPIYWIAANSFKYDIDIFSVPPQWFPSNPTLKHYDAAFVERPFLIYALNSLIIAVVDDHRLARVRNIGRLCARPFPATRANGATKSRSGFSRPA